MDQAGRKGEALLPPAGKFAGQLVAATGETEAFEALLDGGAAVGSEPRLSAARRRVGPDGDRG